MYSCEHVFFGKSCVHVDTCGLLNGVDFQQLFFVSFLLLTSELISIVCYIKYIILWKEKKEGQKKKVGIMG